MNSGKGYDPPNTTIRPRSEPPAPGQYFDTTPTLAEVDGLSKSTNFYVTMSDHGPSKIAVSRVLWDFARHNRIKTTLSDIVESLKSLPKVANLALAANLALDVATKLRDDLTAAGASVSIGRNMPSAKNINFATSRPSPGPERTFKDYTPAQKSLFLKSHLFKLVDDYFFEIDNDGESLDFNSVEELAVDFAKYVEDL